MIFLSRRSIPLVATLFALQYYESVVAFHASLPNRASMIQQKRNQNNDDGVDILIMLRAVSAQEAAERMQQLQQADRAAMEQEQPPLLFDEELIDEMNAAYMTLEKRIQDGPGSLAVNEIDQLENRFRRIIEEMKINEHNRPTKKSSSTESQQQQQQQQQQVQSSPTVITNERNNVLDTSNDEGPVYDGSGGLGQPRGTINTYAIEGMEEMTSEEYIKALQNKVIETQRERRESGRIGSHGTWNYLNKLSGNTAGILNKNGMLNKKE